MSENERIVSKCRKREREMKRNTEREMKKRARNTEREMKKRARKWEGKMGLNGSGDTF